MTNLRKSFKQYDELVQKNKSRYSGLLGVTIGGSKTVNHPTRDGYVYVRLLDNLSEVIQAANDKIGAIYDFPVIVQREGNRWVVVGKDTQRYPKWGGEIGTPYLPKHGHQHSLNRDGGVGADPVWVFPDQFMPGLVYPSGSSGGGNYVISAFVLQNNTRFVYAGNTGTPSILPYIPTTSGTAIMGLVYIDRNTGNPGILINSGTPMSIDYDSMSQVLPYVPYPASYQEPLYAFKLSSGTATYGWDSLYNVRQFMGGGVSTGSSGGVSDHESLTGLLGGSAGNHYHLTQSQIIGLVSGTVTALHSHSGSSNVHNDLSGLQGGGSGDYYHLTAPQILGLVSGTFTALHHHSGSSNIHNDLSGLQGGGSGQYYHLTQSQAQGLTSGSSTSLHTHDSKEDVSNKTTTIIGNETDDTLYPSAGAVADYVVYKSLNKDDNAQVTIGETVTIADDATYSFTPPNTAGMILVQSRSAASTNFVLGFYVTSSGGSIQSYVVGSNTELLTGVMPSPTAGTDGKLCVSVDTTGGVIYIRNRTGSSRNVVIKCW